VANANRSEKGLPPAIERASRSIAIPPLTHRANRARRYRASFSTTSRRCDDEKNRKRRREVGRERVV